MLPVLSPDPVAKVTPRDAPLLGRMGTSERGTQKVDVTSLLRGRSLLLLPPPAGRSKLMGGIELLPVPLPTAPAVLPESGVCAITGSILDLHMREPLLPRETAPRVRDSCIVG